MRSGTGKWWENEIRDDASESDEEIGKEILKSH